MAIGLWPRGKKPGASDRLDVTLRGRQEVDHEMSKKDAEGFVLRKVADSDGIATASRIAAESGGRLDVHSIKKILLRLQRKGKVVWGEADEGGEQVEWQ